MITYLQNIPWWILAILSMLFSSIFILLRKKGSSKEHATRFELTRSLVMVILLLTIIPYLTFNYTIKTLLVIYFISFLATIGILLVAKSIRHAQLSEISPLSNLSNGFVAIFAFLFLGESLSRGQISGIILLIIGAYALESDGKGLWGAFVSHIKSKYVLYAILGTFLFSITALLDKYTIENLIPAIDFLFIVWIFIFINLIIVTALRDNPIKAVQHCLKKSKQYILLAGIFGFLANLTYILALSTGLVSLVIPIRRASTLIVTIVGGEIFHEDHLLIKTIAALIMIIGASLLII